MTERLSVASRRAASPPSTSQGGAIAALVLGAAAMGLSPTLVRLADVGPLASAFWRVMLALPVLWVWRRVDDGRASRAPLPSFSLPVLLAGLAFTADLFFWHLAIVRTTIANATFFATMAPLWVVIFGWILFRERTSRAVLGGLGLCLCGGAALVWQSLGLSAGHAVGDLLGVLTGVFFGLYFLAVRAARGTGMGAAQVTFELSVVTAALLGVLAAVFEGHLLPGTLVGWTVLLALALISHVGGQGLLSVALGRLPAVFSSLVIFLEAIFAAAVAWIVLGEPVTAAQALGGVLIVAGLVVARPRDANQPASQ